MTTAQLDPNADPLLTTEDLARELKSSRRTIEGWRRTPGKGPKFIKIGTGHSARVLYRRSDVDVWLASLVRVSTQN